MLTTLLVSRRGIGSVLVMAAMQSLKNVKLLYAYYVCVSAGGVGDGFCALLAFLRELNTDDRTHCELVSVFKTVTRKIEKIVSISVHPL